MTEKRENELRGADGRYQHFGNFNRLCVCGHRLGIHCAGGWDCFAAPEGEFKVEGLTERCKCQKFRPSRRKSALTPAKGTEP